MFIIHYISKVTHRSYGIERRHGFWLYDIIEDNVT